MATGRPVFVPSAGTVLKSGNYGCATPGTLVASVRSLPSLFDLKADTFETTEVDAVTTGTTPDWSKYFEAGKVDPGELTFKVGGNFTQIGTLQAMVGAGQSWAWGIFFANTGNITFNGPLTGMKAALGDKDELTFELTIKASGAITINPPAGEGRTVPPGDVTLDLAPETPAKESSQEAVKA